MLGYNQIGCRGRAGSSLGINVERQEVLRVRLQVHRPGPGRGVSNASPCMRKPQSQGEPRHVSCHGRLVALLASYSWSASLNSEATISCPLEGPLVCTKGDWEKGRQELVWAERLGEKESPDQWVSTSHLHDQRTFSSCWEDCLLRVLHGQPYLGVNLTKENCTVKVTTPHPWDAQIL